MLSGKRKKAQSNANVRVEVLDEGRIKKRKHQSSTRCHRDDEKERRKNIAGQFELLNDFLPESRKTRTRQEMLSACRELIWELWRNEEILSLVRVDQVGRRIAELEKQIVMKRDKKKQLLSINQTAAESAMQDYEEKLEESGNDEYTIDPITSHLDLIEEDFSETAQILTDSVEESSEGYVLEEVLPPELYYQLATEELTQRHVAEQQSDFTDFKTEVSGENDSDGGMAESIIRDTFKMEEIHLKDENESSSDVASAGDDQASIEVEDICDGKELVFSQEQNLELQGDFRADEVNRGMQMEMEFEVELQNPSCRIGNESSQGVIACGNPDFNLNSADQFPNKDFIEDNPFPKFPHLMPHQMSLYPHLMPFHLWPPFIPPDQQAAVGGYPGFSVPNLLVPNPSCMYGVLPVPLTSPPPQSSMNHMAPCDSGQLIRSDHEIPEVSNNVDVVN